ncbi:hypothetical protein B0H10DRAFT_1963656 [Mycena sp. CBHHK59/15]|nr:hypothetical protein B0H10DRAFT_1963656 [Mycena sp. CBHHK59/15]
MGPLFPVEKKLELLRVVDDDSCAGAEPTRACPTSPTRGSVAMAAVQSAREIWTMIQALDDIDSVARAGEPHRKRPVGAAALGEHRRCAGEDDPEHMGWSAQDETEQPSRRRRGNEKGVTHQIAASTKKPASQAMALQSQAKPKCWLEYGFGFGFRYQKPKPSQQARAWDPWYSSLVSAIFPDNF